MSISLFSAVIILIFFTSAILEIRRGITNGFFRSLVNLGTLILSIISAIVFSTHLADAFITGLFKPLTSLALLILSIVGAGASMSNSILSNDLQFLVQLLKDYIMGLESPLFQLQNTLAAMFSSFLFVLIFFLMRGAFNRVASWILRKKATPFRTDFDYLRSVHSFCQRNSKLLGGIVGVIMAFIISMAITAPVMGNLRVVVAANDHLQKINPEVLDLLNFSDEDVALLAHYSKDLPGNILYELGGKSIYQLTAQAQIDGQLFQLHRSPSAFADTLKQLVTIFIFDSKFDIDLVLRVIILAFLLIGSPIFYLFLTARLLPRLLLIPHSSCTHIKDRGIQKYIYPKGRAITYQAATDMRPYIPQYILSDNHGERFLKCKLDKQIRTIKYRILPFDVNDHPLEVLEVADPVATPGVTSAVALPLNTAYVSICVQEVNGKKITADGNVGFSPVKLGIFVPSVIILTIMEAFLLKKAMLALLSSILPDFADLSVRYQTMILPAILLAIIYAAVIFFSQFTQDRNFLK